MPSTPSRPVASIGTGILSDPTSGPTALDFRGFGWRPVGRRRPAVHDIDLRIEPGERVLLAGPSGAGKSTLLRAAAGVLESAGSGERSGEVVVDDPGGLVLQNPSDAIVADRVGRDVAFGPENHSLDREAIWARVREALELVGFPYDTRTPTSTLSGGEAQRLALAGALAMRPGLLLLDEPTSMLDDEAAAELRDAVLRVVETTGATLVVAGHRIGAWTDHVDRLVVLGADGGLLADGEPGAVLARHGSALADAGLWLPDLPPPDPIELSATIRAAGRIAADNFDEGPLVSAEGLSVRLRRRSLTGWREVEAVSGVDAAVPIGSITCMTGRSGAGKSTLLAALGGLVPPARGEVRAAPALAAGLDPWPGRWRSRELAGRIGWVPQDPEHGFVTHRVVDEVRLTADRLGRSVDTDALLDALGLGRVADASPYHLSGGEQRRLALLAGLAHRPRLALLDEPTVGQDRHTWAAIAGVVRGLVTSGAAVAIATHDRDLTELADHEIVLRRGRVEEPR